MAGLKNIIVFFILSALLVLCLGQVSQGGGHQDQGGPHQDQGGPHENQVRSRRQVSQNENDVTADPNEAGPNVPQNPQNWTTCDITVIPKIYCHDCNTRVICKPVGGLLKPCNNPNRPHCNNGICSPIPSVNCV